MQRVAQKYLAADMLYRANIPSGETEEDARANVMTLYREGNKTKDKHGQYKAAPVIKFIDAVRFLSSNPKFSTFVGGGSAAAAPGYQPTPTRHDNLYDCP